ncbi:MAG: DUF4145 domain-containing protein [Lactobacillus sp.]|nr:DUF4145 domain-containing protein [Lactobacillus sp.]MCH3905623.1 DUF4145 domain-containing protein [Lactobacillus sp.]MCH3990819.1 DUF4145 domain-containing protein [Lactobacillus sp.]MCH4068465.1 DUF4145 domain-containing protein [Lactobacillus sp.]MCI1304214.1 DUF4145 domain-containing protein [Lactobacillus sp.]
MEITFDFLKKSPALSGLAAQSDKLVKLYQLEFYQDVVANSRRVLEALVKQMIKLAGLNEYYQLPAGERYNLRNDSAYLRQTSQVPVQIMNLCDEVRRMGNEAVHDAQYRPEKGQAWHCLTAIHDIMVYVLNVFEQQNLYYLRPDLNLEAQLQPAKFAPQSAH